MTQTTKPIEKWTGPDKVLHFVLIGGFPAFMMGMYTGNPLIGLVTGVALGAVKEGLDAATNNSTVSWKDFAVTCLGAVFGAGVSYLPSLF